MPFFEALRGRHSGQVACEPRHPSWFNCSVEAVFVSARIARVAADPAVEPQAAQPGGWHGLVYRRLHGFPRIYSSPYSSSFIAGLASEMLSAIDPQPEAWCIFDNTMHGEAVRNALQLKESLNCQQRDKAHA